MSIKNYILFFFLFTSSCLYAQEGNKIRMVEMYALKYDSTYIFSLDENGLKKEGICVKIKGEPINPDEYDGYGFDERKFDFANMKPNVITNQLDTTDLRAILILHYDNTEDTYFILSKDRGIIKNGILYYPESDIMENIYYYFPRRYYTEQSKERIEILQYSLNNQSLD